MHELSLFEFLSDRNDCVFGDYISLSSFVAWLLLNWPKLQKVLLCSTNKTTSYDVRTYEYVRTYVCSMWLALSSGISGKILIANKMADRVVEMSEFHLNL